MSREEIIKMANDLINALLFCDDGDLVDEVVYAVSCADIIEE